MLRVLSALVRAHTQSCTVSLILVAALYNCFLPPVFEPPSPIPLTASPLGLLLPSQAQAVTHPSKVHSNTLYWWRLLPLPFPGIQYIQYSTFPSSYQRVEVEVNRIITAECKFAIFRTYTSARRGNCRAQDNGRIIINCTREGRTVVYKSTKAQQQ